MKKAMKWMITLAVLVGVGSGLWMLGEKLEEYAQAKQVEQAETKEVLESTEPGTTYVYSGEDIEEFKKEAQKLLERDIKQFDIQYGENRVIKLQNKAAEKHLKEMLEIGFYTEEELAADAEKTRLNEYYSQNDLSDNGFSITYSGGSTKESIFNKDLSLVKPFVFYGYTSVNNPTLECFRKSNDAKIAFNDFVYNLRLLDDKYKRGNRMVNVVKILVEQDDVGFIGSQKHIGESRSVGATYYLWQVWNEEKKNSLNPLHKLFKVEKLRKQNSSVLVATGYAAEGELWLPYEPLPSEFNYWEVDESEYFTLYWPSSVTKVDDYTYLVDIDTEKPVDRYGATIIAQYIQCQFNKVSENITHGDGKDFKVIVKVDDEIYHDMNQGIVLTDVINGEIMIDADTGEWIWSASENTHLDQYWGGWRPSLESQPWADDYFAAAADAYEKDSYFSIFETIEQVAEKYNVDYNNVENVIMSCYWMYNGHDNLMDVLLPY